MHVRRASGLRRSFAAPRRGKCSVSALRAEQNLFYIERGGILGFVSEDEVERDLDSAGAAIQTFAPGGLWGFAIGGALAILVLIVGALKRAWRREHVSE
jgi:hypothetical protein